MPNAFIPRAQVHNWSETIGENQADHQVALNRLLAQQRRLTRFLEENQAQLGPASAGVALYLFGVVARMYDLAGGQLRSATWDHVRAAASRVSAATQDLLPLDDGFAGRVREVHWRAQPHILDEALMALFERDESDEGEADLDPEESAKVFLLLWVANEVLDACWRPPKSFEGDKKYEYVHIEPKKAEA